MEIMFVPALLFVALLSVPGCKTAYSGAAVSAEAVAALRPGVTTRAEVESELGPPDRTIDSGRVFVYRWQTYSGWKMVQEHEQEPDTTTALGLKQAAFALEFDASNRLARSRFFEREDPEKLEISITRWAQLPASQ